MNTLGQIIGGQETVFIGWNKPLGTENKEISPRKVKWSPQEGLFQISIEGKPTVGKNKNFGVSNMSGTNPRNTVFAMPSMIQDDTFLDNDIGKALRNAKVKFGKAPFIEAYKRVLNTSKKIDDEWEKYLEEEG